MKWEITELQRHFTSFKIIPSKSLNIYSMSNGRKLRHYFHFFSGAQKRMNSPALTVLPLTRYTVLPVVSNYSTDGGNTPYLAVQCTSKDSEEDC